MASSNFPGRLNRRNFIGTITGAAALALFKAERQAFAGNAPTDEIVTDYVGRLCYNENPLGPSPMAQIAIQNEAHMVHRYPDWYADSLVSQLAQHYDVESNQIVCGAGATEILRLSAMALAEPGGNIVAPYPSYSQFPSDVQRYGSTVRYVDLDENYCVDLQATRDRVNSDTTCVCITNPNNPTATIVNCQDLVDFVDDLPEHVVTLIDEAYFEFINLKNHPGSYEEEYHLSAIDMVRNDKNVVVVKTFSKAFGLAGARIGFAIGKQSVISSIKSNSIFATVSRPSLEAAKAALDDEMHVTNSVIHARHAKAYCFNEFARLNLDYIPSQTSFFMVDVGNSSNVSSELASRGIYVRTGWGMLDHIRVSVGTMDEMESFISALEEILYGISNGTQSGKLLPAMTELSPNYPNPFNSSTSFKMYLPDLKNVKLEIFDIHGRLVKTLADGWLSSGSHSYVWNGSNSKGRAVSSGSYFYRLIAGDDVITKRMILVK